MVVVSWTIAVNRIFAEILYTLTFKWFASIILTYKKICIYKITAIFHFTWKLQTHNSGCQCFLFLLIFHLLWFLPNWRWGSIYRVFHSFYNLHFSFSTHSHKCNIITIIIVIVWVKEKRWQGCLNYGPMMFRC